MIRATAFNAQSAAGTASAFNNWIDTFGENSFISDEIISVHAYYDNSRHNLVVIWMDFRKDIEDE